LVVALVAAMHMAGLAWAAPRPGSEHLVGTAPAPGAGGGAGSTGASDPLFSILDADGDGVISAKELKNAIKVLKELDTNKDGMITWEEVVAAGKGNPMTSTTGATVVDQGAGAAGGMGAEQSPVFKRFMSYDKNGDGKLTPDELPREALVLLRDADLNHDGAIDARELAIAVRQMGERVNAATARGMGGPGAMGRLPGGNPAGPNGGGPQQ
jgi:Ca2+-binding EF-hand superfamily protein